SVGLLNVLVEAGSGNSVRTQTFDQEFSEASQGKIAASQRFNERGQRIISVSVPIQRVSAVIGVLTLEANDIDALTRADRAALIPFIVVAILVALIMAAFLALSIAEPLNRLAADADDITVGKTQSLELSRLTRRNDEIGQLAQSVEAMTDALFDRIAANETFAADVAHELKNPLTSIRSAVETAGLVREDTQAQEELRQVIAKDVQRLDRLITDISNASRLEAEMTRATAQRVDLVQFIKDIVSAYDGIENDRNVKVQFVDATKHGVLWINIQDGPLGQVLRNLIDNARSFSPSEDQVIVSLADGGDEALQTARIMVEDNGPGIPEDKLTKIFDRFYTDRPSG
ncbi:MAG: sensor histidine kinase, partial [Henriciella sp.]